MVFENMKKTFLIFLLIILCLILTFYGEIGFGFNKDVFLDVRLPKLIACIFLGGLLALSGLLMQIFFQNPLAGPDILGVSSGSVLFVAFWTMGASYLPNSFLELGAKVMSLLGALIVFVFLMIILQKKNSKVGILIIGILMTSFLNSIVSVLVSNSSSDSIKSYLLWGQGSFRNVFASDLLFLISITTISILPLIFLRKKISIYSLGENYAKSMGVDSKTIQKYIIILTSIYVSLSTYYCGPIVFLGIISPYLAKRFYKLSDLRLLLPASFLIGAILSLFSEVILTCFTSWHLTTNSILGFIGAPILIFYSIGKKDLI